MHTLRLLGTLRLASDDGPVTGRAAQARRRALLALLAAAPDRTLSRDKLVGMVWPETSDSKARHLLSTALYDLRQALGDDALVSHGDHEIRLSRDHVTTDLDAFDDALARADPEAALVAYQGGFLDGFHLRGAPDFERWADGRRRSLRRDLAALLEAAAGAEADAARAAALWEARAGLDPADTRVVLRAVEAMAAAGDPGAARRLAGRYDAARADLELDADPLVRERAQRARSAASGARPAPERSRQIAAPAAPAPDGGAGGGSTHAVSTPRPGLWRRWGLGLAIAAGIASVLGAALVFNDLSSPNVPPRARAEAVPGSGIRVAVLPFAMQGGGDGWLPPATAELLAVRLQVPGAIAATDPFTVVTLAEGATGAARSPEIASELARRVGATHFVLGSVRGSPERLHLTAGLYTAVGDHVGAVTADALGGTALTGAMDSLALRLLAGPLEKGRPVAWEEGSMTSSLPALRAYVAGTEAFRAGDYNRSVRYLQQAVAHDSLFALAYLRLGISAEWAGRRALTREALDRAHGIRDRLTERDRLLLEGKEAATRGDGRAAVVPYRAMVARDPADVEALYEVGDIYFHNPQWGVSSTEAASWFRRALAIDSTHTAATQHLARLVVADQDPAALSRLVDAALAQGVEGLAATELRVFSALMTGDAQALASVTDELRVLSDDRLLAFVLNAARHSLRPERSEPLIRLLTDPVRRREVRAVGEILLGYTDAAAGRRGNARNHLAAARTLDPRNGVLAHALLLGTTDFPAGREELEALAVELDSLPEPPVEPGPLHARSPTFTRESHRILLLGRLRLRLGQYARVREAISLLEAGETPGDGRVLAAELALAEGDRARALERIGAEADSVIVVSDPAGFVPYLRGRILDANDRREDAVRWYQAMRHEADLGVLFDQAVRDRALGAP